VNNVAVYFVNVTLRPSRYFIPRSVRSY